MTSDAVASSTTLQKQVSGNVMVGASFSVEYGTGAARGAFASDSLAVGQLALNNVTLGVVHDNTMTASFYDAGELL